MLCHEPGVLSGSEYFLKTISEETERLLYYQVSCGHYHCENGYHIRRSYMPALILIVIQQGQMKIEYRGVWYHASAGDVVLMDCTWEHYYEAGAYVEFYWMHIAGGNSFEMCRFLMEYNAGIVYHAPDTVEISETIYRMITAYRNHQQTTESKDSVSIYRMLCSLMPDMRQAAVDSPSVDISDVLRQYVEEHLAEEISLQDLAEQAGLSASYLIRLFQKKKGMTPYEYVIGMRIDHARFLLKTTQMPVRDIAAAVGYRSQQGFINAFVQHIGVSPGKYRHMPLE